MQLEKISSRIAKLEKEWMVQKCEIDPEDRLHCLDGTKAEREKQQKAIMERLEKKYPDMDQNESPIIFVHFIAAKDGKPADPADALGHK